MQNKALRTEEENSQPYTQDISGVFQARVGVAGIGEAGYRKLLHRLAAPMGKLATAPDVHTQAIFRSALDTDDLKDVEEIVSEWDKIARTLVVIGTGGSGLSGKTLSLLKFGATFPPSPPRLLFCDNFGMKMSGQLTELDYRQCAFFVVSKSGSTVETLAQMLLMLEGFKTQKLEAEIPKRVVIMAQPGDSPMRQLAKEYGIRVLDHDPDLCGRFSIFSAVGMVPAAFAGVDCASLRAGAAATIARLREAREPEELPFAQGAAIQAEMIATAKPMNVLMPYSERLLGVSLWWRQSWAESIGKNGKGSTPVISLGPVDQHSQLQLYLDGPRDKYFTLFACDTIGQGPRLMHVDVDVARSLGGHSIGTLIAAQQQATQKTLLNHGCPLRLIGMPKPSEFSAGALLMHMALEIILSASLLGVNPFNQPAVEEGKKLARDFLAQTQA